MTRTPLEVCAVEMRRECGDFFWGFFREKRGRDGILWWMNGGGSVGAAGVQKDFREGTGILRRMLFLRAAMDKLEALKEFQRDIRINYSCLCKQWTA